ncbi:MAG: TIGR03084 family metal-binding protein, partial [Acetobacteraceae bacterium]
MLPQAADFRAEVEALHGLLVTLRDSEWDRPTLFKAWTINDIIQHLYDGDAAAAASVAGRDVFAQRRAEIQARRDRGMSRLQETRDRLGALTGRRLCDAWLSQAMALSETLGAMPPDVRLAWSGPDMGVRMFTTARQMETWAHGQAIYDLQGVRRNPDERLRNIAEIGVRTYGWTFSNRKRPVPGPAPHVRLTAPSGAVWEWNTPDPENAVTGDALDFCQVVTQVRNVADTGLQVAGAPARAWMALAQCFAGPPEDPPAPGTRHMA